MSCSEPMEIMFNTGFFQQTLLFRNFIVFEPACYSQTSYPSQNSFNPGSVGKHTFRTLVILFGMDDHTKNLCPVPIATGQVSAFKNLK